MTFQLNRSTAYILSLLMLLIFFATNRINFLMGSHIGPGKIISRNSENVNPDVVEQEYSYETAFVFNATNDCTYMVFDRNNAWVAIGDSVQIVYKESDPFKAKIFSFSGFWMPRFDMGIFSAIVLVLTIFFYSFFPKKSNIFFNFGKQKK